LVSVISAQYPKEAIINPYPLPVVERTFPSSSRNRAFKQVSVRLQDSRFDGSFLCSGVPLETWSSIFRTKKAKKA
jgi:hypothetical protein